MAQNMNNTTTRDEAEVLIQFATELVNNGKSEIVCPRCGKKLLLKSIGSSSVMACSAGCGVQTSLRGI